MTLGLLDRQSKKGRWNEYLKAGVISLSGSVSSLYAARSIWNHTQSSRRKIDNVERDEHVALCEGVWRQTNGDAKASMSTGRGLLGVKFGDVLCHLK